MLGLHWTLPDHEDQPEREAELWTVGETRFLEISERAKIGKAGTRDKAEKAQTRQTTFLTSKLVPIGTGGPKTGRVLRITSAVGVPPA